MKQLSYQKNRMITSIDFLVLFLFCIPVVFSKLKCKNKSISFQRILILELWGIGDLVMMSAILKPLKEMYPDSKITLLSKSYGHELFGESGYICKFIEFDFPWTRFKAKYRICLWNWKGLLTTIMRLRREKFDLILDARGDIRNNLLSFLIGGKKRIGYDWTGGDYLLTDIADASYKSRHRVEAWEDLLKHIGIKTVKSMPYLFVSRNTAKGAEGFLKSHGVHNGDLLIGIHPGAGIKIRCWALDKFAKVAEYVSVNYGAKIVVFIEPDGYGENIPIEGPGIIQIRTSLSELVALISKLDLLICNDSAAMHIATAVDTAVLAIFGPGDAKKIGPYENSKARIIQKDIVCRPCFDDCRYYKALCLDKIEVKDVIKAVEYILKKPINRNLLQGMMFTNLNEGER